MGPGVAEPSYPYGVRSLTARTSSRLPGTSGTFFAHPRASSKLSTSIRQKPPSCSLVSVNGPSVTLSSPSPNRTVVAVLGSSSASFAISTPASIASRLKAFQASIPAFMSSSVPSYMRSLSRAKVSRYFISSSLIDGGAVRRIQPNDEWPLDRSTRTSRPGWGLDDGAHLDRAAEHRHPLRPRGRLVEALALQHHVAGDLLLGLREGAVGDDDPAALASQRASARTRAERGARVRQRSRIAELAHVLAHPGAELRHLLRSGVLHHGAIGDQAHHELHLFLPRSSGAVRRFHPNDEALALRSTF